MKDHSDRTLRAGHRECWELLPWFVNDSLSPAQKQRLQGHLEHCDSCRREADEQALLREHLRREDSVLYAPHASLQKLLNRIDAAGPAPVSMPNELERGSSRWTKMLAASIAIGALTIIAVSAVTTSRLREARSAARYSTLTTSPAVPLRVPAARVVFAPTMSLDQLGELLRRYNAQVITGPSEAGVYTLVFGSRADERRDGGHSSAAASLEDLAAAAIQSLRKDPNVLFVEPVMTGEAWRADPDGTNPEGANE